MRSGTGVECLQSKDQFKKLLAEETHELKGALEAVRARWNELITQPPVPVLPLPLEAASSLSSASVRLPDIDLSSFDILSLDIFDTCLRRLSGEPRSIFEMLETEMAASGQACPGFAGKRIKTENGLRKRFQESSQKEDVSLDDIYTELGGLLGWGEETIRHWKSREQALECAIVVPVESVRELAQNALQAGSEVIYVSEMYLPRETLVTMLMEAGFPVRPDGVFASGDLGLSKGSGRLYEYVRERFPGKKLFHLGDNPQTDVGPPDSAGIASGLLKAPSPAFPDAVSNILAGISEGGHGESNFWRKLGFQVVGPLATSWMLQILNKTASLDQVLFLTRDGYFPKKIYEKLAPLCGVKAAAKTCFSSRRLLGIAAMEAITADDWDFLLKPAPGFCVRDFFERVDLPPETYLPPCREAGIDPDEVVCHHRGFHDPATKDRLYLLFLEVMEAFYPVRDGVRQRLQGYLQSLGFPERATGMVDIGWNGSSFHCLERLYGSGALKAGFYLALWADRQGRDGAGDRLFSYFVSGEQASGEERLIRGGVGLLEFLLGSPHGSVVDLNYTNDEWRPLYAIPDIVGSYEREAYRHVEDGFEDFTNQFVEAHGHLATGDGKAYLRARLEKLVYDPDDREISSLGAVAHVEGWGSSNRLRLLPRIETLESLNQRNLAYAYSGWKGAWRKLEFA
jgi:hypothetical protein